MSGIELNNQQRKYVPHLPTLLAVCETNYARLLRLLRLLPDCDTLDLSYAFEVSSGLSYQIKIIDSSRYTSTLQLAQQSDGIPQYLRPVMEVRMYHDAQMAEVLSSQNISAFKPSYRYPNNKMHQPNEKEMVNRFLAEWLSFCLQQQNRLQSSGA